MNRDLVPSYDDMGTYIYCGNCGNPLCIGDCERCHFCGLYDCYGTCVDGPNNEKLVKCLKCNGKGFRWVTFINQIMCEFCSGQGMVKRECQA